VNKRKGRLALIVFRNYPLKSMSHVNVSVTGLLVASVFKVSRLCFVKLLNCDSVASVHFWNMQSNPFVLELDNFIKGLV